MLVRQRQLRNLQTASMQLNRKIKVLKRIQVESSGGILLKNTDVNILVALEEKSGDHQSFEFILWGT